jgi:hypothetical protein
MNKKLIKEQLRKLAEHNRLNENDPKPKIYTDLRNGSTLNQDQVDAMMEIVRNAKDYKKSIHPKYIEAYKQKLLNVGFTEKDLKNPRKPRVKKTKAKLLQKSPLLYGYKGWEFYINHSPKSQGGGGGWNINIYKPHGGMYDNYGHSDYTKQDAIDHMNYVIDEIDNNHDMSSPNF